MRRGNWQRRRDESVSPVLLVVTALIAGGTIGYMLSDGPTMQSLLSVAGKAGEQRGACDIKGNISASGERIYHLPGDKYYAVTRIDTFRGERWFCSESEAQAAGWRHARV
jgi:hypothetical protein